MKPNREEEYPVFFHVMQPGEITKITVFGDVEISYFGFGDESKSFTFPGITFMLRNGAGTTSGIQSYIHVSGGRGV